jgi:L-threonylcarbamoyladenylate synthase
VNPIVTQTEINQAVVLLKQGKLVAFPTETVYGLGADARNPQAIKQLFEVKGRSADHPVSVLLAEPAQIAEWATEMNVFAQRLAQHFWPGPLTLILPRVEQVSPLLTGGHPTIGIRMPNHPVTQKLLRAFGSGIAAPSANRFGGVSPTQAVQVKEALGDAVALILDGGDCTLGIESTIVDCSGEQPCITRLGALAASEISKVIGQPVAVKIAEKRAL